MYPVPVASMISHQKSVEVKMAVNSAWDSPGEGTADEDAEYAGYPCQTG